jgi:hypothetical protein
MLRIRIGFIEDPDPDPSILGQCGSGSRDPDILCIRYVLSLSSDTLYIPLKTFNLRSKVLYCVDLYSSLNLSL